MKNAGRAPLSADIKNRWWDLDENLAGRIPRDCLLGVWVVCVVFDLAISNTFVIYENSLRRVLTFMPNVSLERIVRPYAREPP